MDNNDNKTKKRCVVLIPVWKKVLHENEVRSLSQCIALLGDKDYCQITFLAPERIGFAYYNAIWKTAGGKGDANFMVFPDRCFEDSFSYSRLLMVKEFYSAFSSYEYMLIYQLDAWIFSDSLNEWCDRGYEYVGAPWCHMCRMGKEDDCRNYVSTSFVGNGGLSLRKIQSMIDKLPYDKFEDVLTLPAINEDAYIAMISSIKRPDCMEAAKFSIETNASTLLKKMNDVLPFGFHGVRVYDIPLCERLCRETYVGTWTSGQTSSANN